MQMIRGVITEKNPGRPIIVASRNLTSGDCISYYMEQKSRRAHGATRPPYGDAPELTMVIKGHTCSKVIA